MPFRLWSKKKILLNVLRESDYEIFRPIYQKLIQDARLDIYFGSALIHKFRKKSLCYRGTFRQITARFTCKEPVLSLLDKYDIKQERILAEWQSKWKLWDMCIGTYFKIIRTVFPTKQVQIFHGFTGKKGVGGVDETINATASQYDALFCFSQMHAELFRSAGFLDSKTKIFCIGFPKLDDLVSGNISRETVLREYGADPSKTTVLYAPTWNPESSLNNVGEELIEKLCGGSWTLLVKPHPISLETRTAKGYRRNNWAEYLTELEQKGKIIFIREQSSPRYLTAADVLITDLGTTLFEYMLLNKPILFYNSPRSLSITTLPQKIPKIRKVVYLFDKVDEAIGILKRGHLKDTDEMIEIKREITQERFYDVGGATGRAAKAIYEILGLEPFGKLG